MYAASPKFLTNQYSMWTALTGVISSKEIWEIVGSCLRWQPWLRRIWSKSSVWQ
jgi:hypothetical protein